MEGKDAQSVGALQVAVFFDELALLGVLAVAGARLPDGLAASIALAPRAKRRLGHPARLSAKLALIVAASALLAWAELPWWSAAFLVVSTALVTLGELSEAR